MYDEANTNYRFEEVHAGVSNILNINDIQI